MDSCHKKLALFDHARQRDSSTNGGRSFTMLCPSILTIGLLAGACSAVSSGSYIELEKRSVGNPDAYQWVKRSRAPSEAAMPVRIALKQRNLEYGHSLLMDISDPDSPNFGKHLSPQKIGEIFEPHEDSIGGVRAWLHDEGVAYDRHVLSTGKGWVKFGATVAEVESLLRTEYHVFEHTDTGEEHVAADRYYLPEHVFPHIDFVTPTVASRPLRKRAGPTGAMPVLREPLDLAAMTSPSDLSHCDAFVTPQCIRAMYGIPLGNSSVAGNELGVFETFSEYDQYDLDLFWQGFAPRVPNGTHPKADSIDGGVPSTTNYTYNFYGQEPLLDFQISIPLVYPQSTILYQVDDPNVSLNTTSLVDTFLDALDKSFCTYKGGDNETIDPHYPDPSPDGWHHPEQCGAYKPTHVISVSYGVAEFDYPPLYEQRQCYEYMKLGLAGTSAIFSSGDTGVAAREGCLGTKQNPAFAPQFIANCPYVTAVGATQLPAGFPVDGQQVAAAWPEESYWSGGGFSNYFAQPAYQKSAVDTFLTQHAPPYPAETFNASGRGYPDVSAVGIHIVAYAEGQPFLEAGTSASAPLFASIITLINEQRLLAGKGPVGFLNPTLYKNPQAFNDIVSGGNLGCGTQGFNATKGWDPVTGLGTPKFDELLKAFMALP